MIGKVIYISCVRLSDKTSQIWYVDYLISKGVTVEYWDVVALVRDDYDEAAAKATDYLRTFQTYSEVEEMLHLPENKNAYYVMSVFYTGFTVRLFRLLSKHGCRMLSIAWGASPNIGTNKLVNKWWRLLYGFSNPLRLATQLYYKGKAIVYRKLELVKQFDVVFAAGRVILANSQYASKVIPINCPDYDQYKKVKLENAAPVVEGRYAVFLDTNLPYHADANVVGWPTVRPNEYYTSLSRFFDQLEAKHRIKVVIAAHPRSDYRDSNPFDRREIYHGKTPELVKDADFAISHHSFSALYAVLNHKPIIFIYTNEMAALYKHTIVSYIRDFAEYLDSAIYNIDEIAQGDQAVIRDVNERCYDDYKYDFLTTHESEQMLTQDILWCEIGVNQ